jgi:hypothetical protein
VRIRSDNQGAWNGEPVFNHQLMAYPVTDVKEARNSVAFCPRADCFLKGRGYLRAGWGNVVKDNGDPVWIPNRGSAHILECFYTKHTRAIVGHCCVDTRQNKILSASRFSRRLGENLLANGSWGIQSTFHRVLFAAR